MNYCLSHRLPLVPSKYSMTVMIFIMMLSFYYFSRHVSAHTPSSPVFVHNLSGFLKKAVSGSKNPGSPGVLVSLTQLGMWPWPNHHPLLFLVSSLVIQGEQFITSFL